MAITDDHGIYYPEVGADLTPLNAAFGTLAQSTDDAITEALDTIRTEMDALFAPSAAIGGRTGTFALNSTGNTVIPITTISGVRGDPAPILESNGIQVRRAGVYFVFVRAEFDNAPATWRNLHINLNGEPVQQFSSIQSGESRMVHGGTTLELDAGDILRLSSHGGSSTSVVRPNATLTFTKIAPKVV